MLCENSHKKAIYAVINPQCYDNEATRQATVTYSHCEKETFFLCDACCDRLRADTKRHGYEFASKRLT